MSSQADSNLPEACAPLKSPSAGPLRVSGADDSATHSSPSDPLPASISPQNAYMSAREPLNTPAAVFEAHKTNGTALNAQTAASRDPFPTLDSLGQSAAPTWIHAGAQRAEAGYNDPLLGWVSVRADLEGGSVHASLVPGSSDAVMTLAAHLPGLNAYLAEHHGGVSAVTVTLPETRLGDPAFPNGGSVGNHLGANSGTGHGATQHDTGDGPGTRPAHQLPNGLGRTAVAPSAVASSAVNEGPSAGASRGQHISVVA